MSPWKNDDEKFAVARKELYTAVIGDICDQVGLRRQFLSPEIHIVSNAANLSLLIGRAMPVLEADVFSELDSERPFGKMLEALDALKKDEVYICAGASLRYALVGELMCTAMIARRAAGAVCDGYVRDIVGIGKLPIPVFARGAYAQDQRGRGTVLEYGVPIEIGGILIRPGDIVAGDADGVLVVPAGREDEVLRLALEKSRSEKTVQRALAEGMSATAAFKEYGIL